MKINATLVGAIALVAIAGAAGWKAGADRQQKIDNEKCDQRIQEVRAASVKALNDLYQINLNLTAERDQAKAEVDKVNQTTAAQYTALAAMLADDRVKREEASTRVEAAAKEAARNARTAGERATAARDLITQIQDRCAGAPIPDDLIRMLDGITNPGSAPSPVVAVGVSGADRPGRP